MSNILKEIRKKHSLTQTELAENLGITRSAIAQIESGKNNISLEVAKKASELFGITVDDLVNNDYSNAVFNIYQNESGKLTDDFYDSYYMMLTTINLNIDQIEVAKHTISRFAEDKKLNARFDNYERAAKIFNYEVLKSQFQDVKSNEKLNSKTIDNFSKAVNKVLFAVLTDLYDITSFEYKSLQYFYNKE
ncbi:helix-turn-helix domain-containing protein [Flavobacterium sp. TR2]|uniref:helix-turn-helix transcriptional regulator n=1 Tax=Flavobacterium sp. TR2 TaxID=2977321 RepID=UPI0021B0EA44|nr:helix-turn-helix transcriptional regulator [Flavobacterium sp. TR2]UWY27642.1 helix-turn-helix domain-containing protein [Flavobacterium sp. TR2]